MQYLHHPVARAIAPLVLLFVFAACDRRADSTSQPAGANGSGSSTPIKVVATTGMIADVAEAVAGSAANVTQLMGAGVDPHLYKPAPGDLRLLESAGLVLHNGLHLEGKLADALHKLGERQRVVAVSERIPVERLLSPVEFEGQPDPHIWFDPELWSLTVERVRDALVDSMPNRKTELTKAAAAYTAELEALHEWAKEQLARVPEPQRVLVTAHDAFAYFGRAYGLEVHGVQGISTDSEASLRDMNALVDLLVARKVPAVFFESSVPPRTVEALIEGCKARGHEVRVGGELFSDAMGPPGTPEATYVGMFRHNVRTIVEALGSSAAPTGTEKATQSEPAAEFGR